MRIMITGAGGFIGSHLVATELAADHSVVAVDIHLERLDDKLDHPRLEAVQLSITDSDAMSKLLSGVDLVYHLASAHLDVSLGDEIYYEVNVSATVRLLEAAYEAGVGRFVHCSSVGVMGNIDNPPADELYECQPGNIYGKSKLAGEKAVLAFAADHPGFVSVVRPAWVYGPSCPRTERLFRMVQKGRFPIFGAGKNLRHPIYVADLIKGLELCAEHEAAVDELFILAGDRPVQLNELLDTIADACGVERPRLQIPILFGSIAGHVAQTVFGLFGKAAPVSPRSMDFYRENNSYSIAKAETLLGFVPQFTLAQGVGLTKKLLDVGQGDGSQGKAG